jgi:hypothetical protein
MALTLKLSQNVLDTYIDWKAQVLHDLHESVPYLYDNTVGDGPYNAWLDPLLTNEWQMLGWNNVQEMTRLGRPGRELLASGLLDGSDVAQRPVVVDVPLGKGHVVLFANNPMYRGETLGSYFLVFNALLNFDRLDTGRKLDTR